MSVVIVLIGFSLLVALLFLGAYIWAVKSGQYDDNYTPSVRILFDDKDIVEKDKDEEKSKHVKDKSADKEKVK